MTTIVVNIVDIFGTDFSYGKLQLSPVSSSFITGNSIVVANTVCTSSDVNGNITCSVAPQLYNVLILPQTQSYCNVHPPFRPFTILVPDTASVCNLNTLLYTGSICH